MYDLMEGVRVIEVAEHTFVPAAGMILADWGADVVKIEKTAGGGDSIRNLAIPNINAGGINPFFEAANRGKRSLALDLTQQEGRDILYQLVKDADVFTTNLRQDARQKLGLEPEDLFAIKPDLVYARGTGYGLKGPYAQQGGFDFPSAWCRGGLAYLQTIPGQAPPPAPASTGDLAGGATIAGAISAALFKRERTGKGSIVDNALYLVGSYLLSQMITMDSIGIPPFLGAGKREDSFSPLAMMYQTKDDRWLNLCLLMPKWWSDFARHLDRPEWVDDPRFADAKARFQNRGELIALLDGVFAERTLAEWVKKLETMEGVWAPLFSPAEVARDEQAVINGFVTPVGDSDTPDYLTGASPAQFDEQPIGALRRSPAFGEHSAEVMRELGLADAQIATLREAGVIL